jgi:hypothetical protein
MLLAGDGGNFGDWVEPILSKRSWKLALWTEVLEVGGFVGNGRGGLRSA